MSRFFISYTSCDQHWAEWVAWQIEKAGHIAIIQAWDFSPGSNFILKMQEACKTSDATIAILSREYLKKGFAASEWAAAFAKDPAGKKQILIPVRVDNIKPDGLLSTIVYVDLYKVSNEKVAVDILHKAILKRRVKPMKAPEYPEVNDNSKKPHYPGEHVNGKGHNINIPEMREIEIRINQDFENFSSLEQDKILKAIRELLCIDYNLRVTKITHGSVLLTIRLQKKDALKLLILDFIGKIGKLPSYGVMEIIPSDFAKMEIDDILNEYNKLEHNPLITGNHETGEIVFVDEHRGYGIIQRALGGYLKFQLHDVGWKRRGEVSVRIKSDKIDGHILDR